MKRLLTSGMATTFVAMSVTIAAAQHISWRAVIERVEGVVYVDGQRLEPPAASNFGNQGSSGRV
jgi:hypothetical protein